jgi:hypothetical protein
LTSIARFVILFLEDTMQEDGKSQGRKISIAEACTLSTTQPGLVWWRPEPELPETEQYALVYEG